MARQPRDPHPYPRDNRSQPLSPNLADGCYVFVEDLEGVVNVLPDGPHVHPRVLGGGRAANYAGDFTIRNGRVRDLTNLSGTFLFGDAEGLLRVARVFISHGYSLE